MKLYYSPGSCSLSPHIVAREADIPVELVRVDLGKSTLADGGAFQSVNGKGYVPALELPNGEVLTEGPAIVQYLADQKPDRQLAPRAGSLARYRLQEWLNFITSELHKGFSSLFHAQGSPEWKANALGTLTKRLDWLERQLVIGPFLMGEQFTVADAYLFSMLRWARFASIDLADWPALATYLARVRERPRVQEALKVEGIDQVASDAGVRSVGVTARPA